ncbi:hypothetical protein TYRP_010421 [Tyrophagus putrescentiae]|nr:hypothetical protein TYRP_010421 [Tyrophagus putrescentiae]
MQAKRGALHAASQPDHNKLATARPQMTGGHVHLLNGLEEGLAALLDDVHQLQAVLEEGCRPCLAAATSCSRPWAIKRLRSAGRRGGSRRSATTRRLGRLLVRLLVQFEHLRDLLASAFGG